MIACILSRCFSHLNIFILHKKSTEIQNINKVLIFDVPNLLEMQRASRMIITSIASYFKLRAQDIL